MTRGLSASGLATAAQAVAGLACGDGQVEQVVARARLAIVTDHRHDPRGGRHRDPGEEVFEEPTVIFSEGEPWSFRSAAGEAVIDGRCVLIVAAGAAYEARHERAWPEDRSTTVRLDAGALQALGVGDSAWTVPTRSLGRTPRLEAIRLDIAHAATAGDVEALDAAILALVDVAGATGPGSRGLRPAGAPLGGSAAGQERVADAQDRVANAAAWLRANLDRDLDLAELGRAAGTSPFHLSRLFRRHLGLPPFAYLRQVRLERAAQLLRDGGLPVTEVCYEAGFGSLSHFVTAFRTAYGVSPGAYRRGRRAA